MALSGALFTVFALTVLGLVMWAPTLMVFYRKRRRGEAVLAWHLLLALVLEAAALVVLAAVLNAFRLLNIGGYLLIVALVVGAGGGQIFSRLAFKPQR